MSSSSKTPTDLDLEQLAAAIAADPAIGPGTDWTRLTDDGKGRIARLLDTHGQQALVNAARVSSSGRGAPATPGAWIPVWDQLATRKPDQAVVGIGVSTRCAVHKVALDPANPRCVACETEDEPEVKPNVGKGARPPAELVEQVRNELKAKTA